MPVRLPQKTLKQIAKLADALGSDRSTAIRWLLDQGLASGLAIGLLRSGKGRGFTGEIVAAVTADLKAEHMAQHAARASRADRVQAEVNALRAQQEAQEQINRIADRLAVKQARQLSAPPAQRPREVSIRQEATPPRRSRRSRLLTDSEIKAAADRAVARSQKHD